MKKDIDLDLLYEDEWLDLQADIEPIVSLLWEDLEYWQNGKTIKIQPFKIKSLETLSDLEYYEAQFESHVNKVYDFCLWIKKAMKNIFSGFDEDYYKEYAQERWDEMDEEEKEEYDDFEDFWEKYSSSNSFYEMISEDQRMQWNYFRDEFKDVFKIFDDALRRSGDYFDSYGNLVFSPTNKFKEGVDELRNFVKYFKSTLYNLDEMSHEERVEFFDNLFN